MEAYPRVPGLLFQSEDMCVYFIIVKTYLSKKLGPEKSYL